MQTVEEMVPFRFPIGHNFVLMEVKHKGSKRYVIADTPERALALTSRDGGKGKASIVNLQKLINDMGHRQTNHFLRRFGDEWVAKFDTLFFRHGPMAI